MRNRGQRMLGGWLCAALLLGMGTTARAQARSVRGMAWSEPNLQGAAVYAEPRADAAQIGTLEDGDSVEVFDETGNGWYLIQWMGDSNKDTSTAYARQEDIILVAPDWEMGFQGLVAPADGRPVPLYQRPEEGSRVLGLYYPGNEVIAPTPDWDWAFVVLKGGTWFGEGICGYMRTDALQLETHGAGVDIAFGELRGEDPAQVLRKPHGDARVLGPLEPGAMVRVLGESGDFLHIATGCFTGYVPRARVEILSGRYSHDIPPLTWGQAFAVARGEPGGETGAFSFCDEKAAGCELAIPAGSGLWVLREMGEWVQAQWHFNPDMFVRADALECYPAPSVFRDDVQGPSLGTGSYVVGEDLPVDAYCFRVPAGGGGTLEISWPGGETRTHTPVPGTIFNVYLPGGATATLSGDGVLEAVDKTWLRSVNGWEFPPDATGRYIGGLNLECGHVLIALTEGATGGYYRLHRISQEAEPGEAGERIPLTPGTEQLIEVQYGDILEIVNGHIWTNG